MAADSTSTAMAMMASSSSLYLGSSLPSPSMSPFHLLLQQQPHQMEMEMLSFQSMDSPAAPTFPQPPNAASMPMLLPPSSSSSSSPSPPPPPSSSPAFRKYEFVTGSPADWTDQEVAVLNDGLLRYAHEPNITKYIKIAAMLPTKTIRDVALRCWWPTGKEGKRGKPDEVYMGKTTRGLKENMVSATLPATFQIQSPNNMVSFSISMHHQGQNTLIRKEVHVLDSATRHLLEENNQLLSQIAENIETFKMVENMDLFLRTNNNIRTVLKRMNETPGIMGQMPPLPIPVNEGSLNSLLQMDRMVGAYGVP